MEEKCITLPEGTDNISDNQGSCRVIEIVVKNGDYLSEGDTVIVIESDAFTMDVPSPENGIVVDILVELGQAVDEKTALLTYRPIAGSGELKVYAHESDTVFLVHGRNDGLKETVARCIEKLGLCVTVLHEKPNEGKAIIEKFEDNAWAEFAVVLMTADDRGGLKNQNTEDYQFRSRQNVIFELGYFIAKLGRKKVCALYEPAVEMPSDYSGVTYIEIDDKGGWRYQLAREFNHAGLSVDLNNLIK